MYVRKKTELGVGELKKRTFAGETRESVHSKTAETRPSARTDSNERMQWETSLVDTAQRDDQH